MATMKAVKDLKENDLIDLEGDEIADPYRGEIGLQYEYARVLDMEWEGTGCVVVETSQGTYGFPPDHCVPMAEQ